jgi:hypothetical protein
MSTRHISYLLLLAIATPALAAADNAGDPEPLNGPGTAPYANDSAAALDRLTKIHSALEKIDKRLAPEPPEQRRDVNQPAPADNHHEHVQAAEKWLLNSFARDGDCWQTFESSAAPAQSWRAWQIAGVKIATVSSDLRPVDKLNGADERFVAQFGCEAYRKREGGKWERWLAMPPGVTWQREFTRESGQWKGWGMAPFIRNATRDLPAAPDPGTLSALPLKSSRQVTDAETAALEALEKVFLRRGGEWFTAAADGTLWHIKNANLELRHHEATAGQSNGVEADAHATLNASANRSFKDGKWNQWENGLPAGLQALSPHCQVRRIKGEWSAGLPNQLEAKYHLPPPASLPADASDGQ